MCKVQPKYTDENNEKKVLEILRQAEMPCSCDYIAFHVSVSWPTARSLLLNMVIKHLIEMEKTSKSMIFRLPAKNESEA
jgi:hypothetical protein